MRASLLGDSQGDGLEPVLGPVLARHGYALDANHSWTRSGAGIAEIASHANVVGPADLVLVVSGGGNDQIRDAASYRAKIVDLVSRLRAAGASDVVFVTAMHSDDPRVAQLHDAAREAVMASGGIPGARVIDGYRLSAFVSHPDGNPTHYSMNGYAAIALELEKALFDQGIVTAVGMAGTLAFLGAGAVVAMEWLYSSASAD